MDGQLERGQSSRTVAEAEFPLLYGARAVRGIGDGFAAIILPAYLSALGYGPFEIGLIASAALLGSAVTTVAIGFLAVLCDLRTLLIACASLMLATGAAVPNVSSFMLMMLVVFFGTINPTTGDIGPHVPLEQSWVARTVADSDRTRFLARYSLVGALSVAAGALTVGLPDLMASAGVTRLASLKVMFYAYGLMGLIAAVLYSCLSRPRGANAAVGSTALGPSRRRVYKLAGLFAIDAFAGGFAAQSLLALWLFEHFELSLAAASVFFFGCNLLSALSYPVAARLGSRFGLVNTMVFTHLPSNVCLILAALVPSLLVVLGLLLIRALFSQMDVPTRTSYVLGVVMPAERTAAASAIQVPRSLASSASPMLSGALLSASLGDWPLIICGTLKIVYDLLLYTSSRHLKPPEEQQADATGRPMRNARRPGRLRLSNRK